MRLSREDQIRALKDGLAWVLARHDCGALSPPIYAFVRNTEREIADLQREAA
jgi:hypothetical protein